MKETKNVLITGVAGFIGSNLLDYLIENTDWTIVGYDNFSTGNKKNVSEHIQNKRFVFFEKNIDTITSLKEFDCVFHLAALPRIQPSFEFVKEHINENLVNAMHLIELMIKENYFPRFIFSSSSAIYGTPINIPTNEEEKIDCLSPYAFQKYEVEKYLELLSTRYPINYVNLRYFNPYGPRSFNPENKFNAYSSVVGIFLYRFKNKQKLLVTGDGEQKRDFIHVADLAKANYLAAIYNGKLNTSFNIGNGNTISVLELAKMITNEYEFIPKREGESEITFADITKAKEVLGWTSDKNLKDYILEKIK
ncbi:MAG: NAD-dependent epimerase/dehydratase family protein [Bacteroidetes bacterium]|nr:NAD-dependent epimerase/dehydratase family protein [Bacteroidota bacterium]